MPPYANIKASVLSCQEVSLRYAVGSCELVERILKPLKNQGKKIVALGASHSTTVMLYHFRIKD